MMHASELTIDRMLAGELSHDDAAAVRAHAADCTECGGLLETAEAIGRRFAAAPPPLRFAPRRRTAFVGATAALAAALAIVIAMKRGDEPEVRTKGRPSIGVFVQHGGVLRRAQSGEVVAPGDRLQLVATTERAGWLAIEAVDGTAAHAVYARSQPVPAGRDRPLPFSIIIDNVLGPTTITATFCPRPFASPDECTSDTFALEVR